MSVRPPFFCFEKEVKIVTPPTEARRAMLSLMPRTYHAHTSVVHILMLFLQQNAIDAVKPRSGVRCTPLCGEAAAKVFDVGDAPRAMLRSCSNPDECKITPRHLAPNAFVHYASPAHHIARCPATSLHYRHGLPRYADEPISPCRHISSRSTAAPRVTFAPPAATVTTTLSPPSAVPYATRPLLLMARGAALPRDARHVETDRRVPVPSTHTPFNASVVTIICRPLFAGLCR